MSVADSSQIMLSVASVIGLKVKGFIPRDRIILSNLDNQVTRENIIPQMQVFGDVEAVSVTKRGGFGVCRFSSRLSVDLAMSAARRGCFIINNTVPNVHDLEPPLRFLSKEEQAKKQAYNCSPTRSSDSPTSVNRFPNEDDTSLPDSLTGMVSALEF